MRISLIILLFLYSLYSHCQELSYKQFTVKDGLPGSIIYQSLQDNNGFIWFATNQGVSRFDGRTFRNFTKEDGLPDNDIIKLYLDKHNNLWFIPLMGIPSVYYKNSIIRMDGYTAIRAITEDKTGDSIILIKFDFNDSQCGYYQSVNKPGEWNFVPHLRNTLNNRNFPVLRTSSPGKFNVYASIISDTIQQLLLKGDNTEKQCTVRLRYQRELLGFGIPHYSCLSSNGDGIFYITPDSLYYAGMHAVLPLLRLKDLGLNQVEKHDVNYLFSEDDSTLWLCTRSKGLLCIRDPLTSHRTVSCLFDQSFCTSILKDQEHGYWITTHSDGVYYLPNLSFHSVTRFPSLAAKSVRCIQQLYGQQIGAGFSDGNIMIIRPARADARLVPLWADRYRNNRVLDIDSWGPDIILAGTDAGLYRVDRNGNSSILKPMCAIKELFVASDSTIITATSAGVFTVTIKGQQKQEILLARATCVTGSSSSYFYWGTLHGLYLYQKDSSYDLGKKFPALSGVINHIDIAPDSSIWVSTVQGISILKNGRLQQITREQGLLSNLCKHISFDSNTCWVSTDKGISRIAYRWDKDTIRYSLSNITEEDGLTANDVNQTVPAGRYIWAATGRGISFFSKDYVSRAVRPPLINITRIAAGDSTLDFKDTISLGARVKRFLVELSGISFHSGKEMAYEYHLKGLDSNWRRIAGNSIEFQSLPFGNYSLEVRAIDRWDVRSIESKKIFIMHPPPFWLTTWFILSSYIIMALAAGACVYIFHRYRRYKREKDYQIKKKMQDLELMALRAQMNPHFIFNCLTSIQCHIMRSDIKAASTYLHKFSTLIRQTLQNSATPTILLRDEIRLLELYLDLEKLRLGERMDYHIHLSHELKQGDWMIPSMIVQPYVENAIKHGISPLENTKGILTITFRLSDGFIECIIDDNDPGIDAAGRSYPTNEEHRSMGTNITQKRIDTINALQKEKVRISIKDKHRSSLPDNGTLVQLYFPITSN
jgi:ligand-binding sensor domain-containing protein